MHTPTLQLAKKEARINEAEINRLFNDSSGKILLAFAKSKHKNVKKEISSFGWSYNTRKCSQIFTIALGNLRFCKHHGF